MMIFFSNAARSKVNSVICSISGHAPNLFGIVANKSLYITKHGKNCGKKLLAQSIPTVLFCVFAATLTMLHFLTSWVWFVEFFVFFCFCFVFFKDELQKHLKEKGLNFLQTLSLDSILTVALPVTSKSLSSPSNSVFLAFLK